MTARIVINDFLTHDVFAVVGVSRSEKKFGNIAYRELRNKGYRVYTINPKADVVEGDHCYHSFKELPEKVDGAVIIVPPHQALRMVREAYEAGIVRVWLQQGAESDEAIRFCEEKGIELIYGECILMFAEPAGFVHRAHRWVWGLAGKLPA